MPLFSQHSPYDSQLRRRVGLGYKEISGLLGGKPAARTVGRICAEYIRNADAVGLRGGVSGRPNERVPKV